MVDGVDGYEAHDVTRTRQAQEQLIAITMTLESQ